MTELDDTLGCPLGVRCEACGLECGGLAVRALRTDLGVLCLTLCPGCRQSTVTPPVTVSTAARLVHQHAGHVGLTIEQADAALIAEVLRTTHDRPTKG